MSEQHDEVVSEQVAYLEVSFEGVTHRVPVTPEQARRWVDGKEAVGLGRGEPFVDEHGRLIEHHGLPSDSEAEHPDTPPWSPDEP